jgi:hypothetical protein
MPLGRNSPWAVKLPGRVTGLGRGLARWVGPIGHRVCGQASGRQRPWRPVRRGAAAARTTSPSRQQGAALRPPGDRGGREDSVLRFLELGRSPAATVDGGGFGSGCGDGAGPLRRGRCGRFDSVRSASPSGSSGAWSRGGGVEASIPWRHRETGRKQRGARSPGCASAWGPGGVKGWRLGGGLGPSGLRGWLGPAPDKRKVAGWASSFVGGNCARKKGNDKEEARPATEEWRGGVSGPRNPTRRITRITQRNNLDKQIRGNSTRNPLELNPELY